MRTLEKIFSVEEMKSRKLAGIVFREIFAFSEGRVFYAETDFHVVDAILLILDFHQAEKQLSLFLYF